MLLQLLILIIGFLVLTWSADRFVVGAAAMAHHLGVSTLVIGLTIVGIGTSAPEMLVSAIAAYQGNPGLSLGNAIGSNITNVGLILGLTALLMPLHVRSRLLRREMPLLLVIMAVTLALLWNLHLGRVEGVILLGGMALLLGWLGYQGRRGAEPDMIGLEFEAEIPRTLSLRRALSWLILGLVLLLISSRILVMAAVSIAEALGVSDLVIGLTIVALGTSLPELAAAIASARKAEYDIAIGNVIGSNMFNLLGVVGLAGVIRPMDVDPLVLTRDYPVMVGFALAFITLAWGWRRKGRINRIEGGLLLVAWVGYQTLLFITHQ